MTVGHFSEIALAETYLDVDLNKVQDSLLICPSFGVIWYTEFDLGYPEIRESSSNLPGASGTFDETRYHGARSVSMSLIVLDNAYNGIARQSGWDSSVGWESASYWLSRLGSWMVPEKRYRLYFRKSGLDPRWMDVRPNGMNAPTKMEDWSTIAIQLQWVNPSGRMYSFNEGYDTNAIVQSATRDGRNLKHIKPVDTDYPGRTYPETSPYTRDYPGRPEGTDSVLYRGTARTGFIANLVAKDSTLVDPRIEVFEPNGTLSGTIGIDYTVAAGDFVQINSDDKTVLLNGIPGNLLNQYLIAPTKWPVLTPGRYPLASSNTAKLTGYNRIDFSASSFDEDAVAEIEWYDAFIY